MSNVEFAEEITKAVEELDESKAEALVMEALVRGFDPDRVLQAVVAGLKALGRRFERKEYFVLELMEGGEIGRKLVDVITPYLPPREGVQPARVVIGSVKNDIHDIGKSLVTTQLRISGFEVYDLGVNVASMVFIDKAREVGADIIALSAFTTMTMVSFKEVLDYLRDMGLRGRYKVIIGGGTTSMAFAKQIGADGWAPDAVEAVTLCESMVSRKVGAGH